MTPKRSERTRYKLRNIPTDPITAAPIRPRTHFQLRLGPVSHSYDAISLARTIIASPGPPRDPLSQIPIPLRELERLDHMVQTAGQRLPAVSRLLRRQQHKQSDPSQCMIELMELRISDTVQAIFTNLDLYTVDNEETQTDAYYHLYLIVVMVAIPDIMKYLSEIQKYDTEHALHLSTTVQQQLRGPPPRPLVDPTKRVLKLGLAMLSRHHAALLQPPAAGPGSQTGT